MRDYSHLRPIAEAMLLPHAGAVDDKYFDTFKPALVLEMLDDLAACAVKLPKRDDYPSDFEACWEAYPQRAGANKRATFKAWTARVRSGVTPAALLAGAVRYAEYVKAERTQERYIKQASTFYGPDEHYALPWLPSRGAPARASVNDEAKRRLFGGSDAEG